VVHRVQAELDAITAEHQVPAEWQHVIGLNAGYDRRRAA
jgi:hypothetical protein